MFISQNYSYAILRPLQREILARGGEVKWFFYGDEVNQNFLRSDESCLETIDDVISGNQTFHTFPGIIPNFIPEKVAVFHGLILKTKSKRIRRSFYIEAVTCIVPKALIQL